MLRKFVLKIGLVLAMLVPLAAGAAQSERDEVAYSPQVVQAALDRGRAVLLDFGADW